jgi:hypothetical protein
LLNNTLFETVVRKSKKNTFDYESYYLAPSYLIYTFDAIWAAVLGISVLLLFSLVLYRVTKAPPSNNNEAQIRRLENETLNLRNLLNRYENQQNPPFGSNLTQRQGPSVVNNPSNQTSNTANTSDDYLTGIIERWSWYNVMRFCLI